MKGKALLLKILYVTLSGKRLHCWCDSDVGRIKKENKNVPQNLWDEFEGIDQEESTAGAVVREAIDNAKLVEPKLKWHQKFWEWIIDLIRFFWKHKFKPKAWKYFPQLKQYEK